MQCTTAPPLAGTALLSCTASQAGCCSSAAAASSPQQGSRAAVQLQHHAMKNDRPKHGDSHQEHPTVICHIPGHTHSSVQQPVPSCKAPCLDLDPVQQPGDALCAWSSNRIVQAEPFMSSTTPGRCSAVGHKFKHRYFRCPCWAGGRRCHP